MCSIARSSQQGLLTAHAVYSPAGPSEGKGVILIIFDLEKDIQHHWTAAIAPKQNFKTVQANNAAQNCILWHCYIDLLMSTW